MLHEDHREYFRYTGPLRLDKAMHSLEGILHGITIDGRASEPEIEALINWISDHREFVHRHPFNEVIPRLNEIVADGIVDEEECADILWLCDKLTTENAFFDEVSSDMQRLHGLLRGISADGEITKEELDGLQQWMDKHSHLRTCWPYDELESLLIAVLRDGKIDSAEHETLLRFFSEFSYHPGQRSLTLREQENGLLISGVCATCPEVVFEDRTFCFTGSSERGSRRVLAAEVESRRGRFSNSIAKTVNYLVIGAAGNPCWAYACYGRKVEQAISLRRQGHKLVVVHEYDFWDAVEDS